MPEEIKKTIGKVAIVPRGEWKSDVAYHRLDIVTLDGSTYMALKENQNWPVTNETYWMLIAKKGRDGNEATAEIVSDWLEQHISQSDSVVIDNSLTTAGAAADAKAVGDAIEAIARGGGGGPSGSGLTIDQIYPPGSVYISVSETSPKFLFGGKWRRIEGRFLLGVGTVEDKNNNSQTFPDPMNTDGALTVALTSDNNGPHTHDVETGDTSYPYGGVMFASGVSNWTKKKQANVSQSRVGTMVTKADATNLYTAGSSGKGTPFSIMPPYFTVYMWYRLRDDEEE